MESSKTTVHHIKQVAGNPQAVQMNLMKHQHTEIPPGKHKKKNLLLNQNNQVTSMLFKRIPKHHVTTRRAFDPRNVHKNKDRCSKCGDYPCGRISVPCKEIPV